MPGEDARAPWWARAPARLALLLVVLAVVACYGVPKIIANASPGTSAPQCPFDVAPLAKESVPDVEFTAYADRLFSLPGRGRLDTWGLQEPDAAWADNPPRNLGLPHSLRVDAGIEMRWWSAAGDHLGASLFVFPDDTSAAEYVNDAASALCRADAIATAISRPSGARAVIWANPEGYLQTDIYFARGRNVYRLAAVAPGAEGEHPRAAGIQQLLRVPASLACDLADARCGRPSGSSPLARKLAQVRLEGIHAGDIVEVDRLGRRFHALVTGNAPEGLAFQPFDRRITYRSCRAHQVRAHWAKRGRPRATEEPLEPSPLQLELDTTVRD